MFPAYAPNKTSQVAAYENDISWLRYASYSGPAGGVGQKSESESSDSDAELLRAVEQRKAQGDQIDVKQPTSTGVTGGTLHDVSSDASDGESRRPRKDAKKHKRKHRRKDRDESPSRRKKHSKKKKKDSKRKRRRNSSSSSPTSPTPDISRELRRKWAFIEGVQPSTLPFVLDTRGDQSNRAFSQLPHTSAAVYKVRVKGVLRATAKKAKRYFKMKMPPPSVTVEVNEKLRVLKPSSFISLGDALVADRDDESALDARPNWPSLVREHTHLANRCRSEPHNVNLWLRLCDFEKVFVPCSLAGAQVTGPALTRMIMEKQLSVISDAIMKNPTELKLRIRKFDLLCALERQDQLAREWDDVLRMSDYSIGDQATKNRIWLAYAQYARSKFSVVAKFSVEEATAGYRRAIDAFRRTRNDDSFLLSLIEDFAYFLVECDHREKAVAIFQAVLDFNLSQPGHLSSERNEDVVKTLFESFWDSASPKIGESGHVGWSGDKTVAKEAPFTDDNDPREDELIASGRPPNVVWATLETLRQRKHWIPAKVDAEDVERIVLFEDVSMCVFRTRDPTCMRDMLKAFMKFLAAGDGSYVAWDPSGDKMAELLSMPFARDEAEDRAQMLWNCYLAGKTFLAQFDWAEELLDRLLQACPSDKNQAVALGKRLLQVKDHQMNLTLWAKLLQILAAGRTRDEAMSRGVKLMSMATAGLSNFSGNYMFFLAVYLRIHLGVDNLLKVNLDEQNERMPDIKSLFSFWGALVLGKKANLSEVDTVHLACLEKYLNDRMDEHSIEVGVIMKLALCGPLHAYCYLNQKASVLSVGAYHRIDVLLHLLVYRHFSSSLADFRSTLELACQKHPTREHMVLLALVSYRRPCGWMHCRIPEDKSEDSWYAVILFHLLRNKEFSDWKEREEIAYNRTCLGSLRKAIAQLGEIKKPLYWRLIAWAEMQAGERERAKELLLRGLQCCPWSKAIFVDCALYFDEMLQQVVDTLTEKGLRVRTPLEELHLLLETHEAQQ